MNAMEEAKKRAAEMQATPDSKFDFKSAAQAIGGTQIPATYAFGLSPENVVAQAQLGQQALKTKQQAVQETIESAMQRDNQLAQKLQLAHQTVMSEKKHALDMELAQVEKAKAAASIKASNAQVGLMGAQTLIAEANLKKMNKELAAIDLAEKLVLPVPMIGKDGKTEVQEVPVLAAQAAGFNISSIVSSQIRANAKSAEKAKPWIMQGMDNTDGYILGERYADIYKNTLNNFTKIAGQGQGGFRNKGAKKTPEQIQQEALAATIEAFKPVLSPAGYEKLKSLNIIPEPETEEKPSSDGTLKISPEDMEVLRNTLMESTR